MQVGFIGTGSMGTILIESLLKAGALSPRHITAANRTARKVEQLAARYPGMRVAYSNAEAAEGNDIVFLCIKPHEFRTVLDEIKRTVHDRQIVVSITSPVTIGSLESWLPAKIAKVIPSITNYMLSGALLCMYGSRMTPADIAGLERLLAAIGRPVQVNERFTRVSSDISSCGPAFFAFLLQKFIDAAAAETGIPREEAERLACEMLRGTGALLTDGGLSPGDVQCRVAVPGGITAKGLKLMEESVGDLFHRLIGITHAKYFEEVEKAASSLDHSSD